ncbi:DNA-binding transcriptional regulator [Pelagicoccus sp. SDUM812003]|uniref:AraC family transcriptional regulator n=1 Tax=Pelagicoccus sp. SDUM812003 TaxID=3041267 RepID=UPI00280D5ACB|nr:DNA-binding transcriptional regulator [Pelagicoccus sp. SDUM812003]MDQ8201472.1 DNA-binding transcriptional regulator [Pelagicoccus sp. SDUM812003]
MKNIAILIETSLASGRAILGGISRYLHETNDWSIFHYTGPLGSLEPSSIDQWKGDGIIARISRSESLELVARKGVPIVDVLGNVIGSPYPVVSSHDAQIGELGASHLMEMGHRNFAFLGVENETWSNQRLIGFREHASAQSASSIQKLQLSTRDREPANWPSTLTKIENWLASCPVPLGLMIASDQFAPIAFEACRRRSIAIPEQVSIISVDNDSSFCDLCQPRLTSIEPNHNEVGYQAAKLLDQILHGSKPNSDPTRIPPLTIHRRLSSDFEAVDDPSLAKALQLIREKACEGISVEEIASAAGLSRSVLQRRFKETLGRTVGRSIQDVKLRRACDMLSFTTLPIIDVAIRSGFNYQEYLNQVFKRCLNTTPAKYRRKTNPSKLDLPGM